MNLSEETKIASVAAEKRLDELQTSFDKYTEQLEEMTIICDQYKALFIGEQNKNLILLRELFSIQTYIERLGRFSISKNARKYILAIISKAAKNDTDTAA